MVTIRGYLLIKYFFFLANFNFPLLLLSNILYGEIILNPQKIYGTNITASSLISSESGLLQEFISLLKTFFIIMFSSEFGLFWVSPIYSADWFACNKF